MNELIVKLTKAGLVDGDYIILETIGNGKAVVDITTFAGYFEAALSEDNQYEALLAADDNGDGTSKGYSRFFIKWHSQGLI